MLKTHSKVKEEKKRERKGRRDETARETERGLPRSTAMTGVAGARGSSHGLPQPGMVAGLANYPYYREYTRLAMSDYAVLRCTATSRVWKFPATGYCGWARGQSGLGKYNAE